MRPLYIIDNSILIKALSDDEEDNDLAKELLYLYIKSEINIILPHLWLYESGNAILNVKPKKTLKELILALSKLKNFNFEEKCVKNTDEVLKLCCEYNVTFYDAYYHALAFQEDATLITADEKYYQKAKKAGHLLRLKDFK